MTKRAYSIRLDEPAIALISLRILLGLLGMVFLWLWGLLCIFAIMWAGWGDGAGRFVLLAPLGTFFYYFASAVIPLRPRLALLAGLPLQLPVLYHLTTAAPLSLLLAIGPVIWSFYVYELHKEEKIERQRLYP